MTSPTVPVDAALDRRAHDLLQELVGRPGPTFRPDQLDAIRSLAGDRRRVLLVQRTGWGKSAVYFIATKLLREAGAGPTLLVSPLLALMRNQIEAAERMGIRAVTINSANRDDWAAIEEQLQAGEVDLLLISPERLANPQFRAEVLPEIGRRSGLLVIDEAHCISDWGHDFRPDYRRIVGVLDLLPTGVPVVCCTATANDRVIADITEQLGADLLTLRGGLGREGLALQALEMPSPPERMAWLATNLPRLDGSGIVYCLTVRDAENLAGWLRNQGIEAVAYHGQSEAADRPGIEDALLADEVKVVVATSALGMGFDKPDLAFVVHFQSPGSPVAYYQQVGRAGRQLDRSLGVLLAGIEDADIQDHFITTAFPPREVAERAIDLLERSETPLSARTIEAEVNVRPSRLATMLKVLEVDGAVTQVPRQGYARTSQPWAYDQDRVDTVTAHRRAEQAQMREYLTSDDCRMQFLRRLLDDGGVEPCGVCDNCTGVPLDATLDPALVARARDFIRSKPLAVDPRRQWPSGVPGVKGRLGDLASQEGRALSVWNDGGWGDRVAFGKFRDGAFDDDLVAAAAQLFASWDVAAGEVAWVAAVPSRRRPALVPDFARRLALQVGLPYADTVSSTRETAPQHEQRNSAQQVRNLLGAFAVDDPLPPGAVLLVDDTYDSRWTLTVVGAELRRAGVPAVYPLVLAEAVGR